VCSLSVYADTVLTDFLFFFFLQNANKPMYGLPVLLQVNARLLVLLPTTTGLSFSSSSRPATNRCLCPPALLRNSPLGLHTPSVPSLPLLPPNPAQDCRREIGGWGKDYKDLLGNLFACTKKGCKHTKSDRLQPLPPNASRLSAF